MNNNYIICGIHTDCGKSVASVLLFDYLKARLSSKPLLIKPIQTGNTKDTDFYTTCGINEKDIRNYYSLTLESSIHTASEQAKTRIDLELITQDINKLAALNKPVIVELAGGLLSPIDNQTTMLDLVKRIKFPLILVIDNYLGAINHALLTISLLQMQNIAIAGLIFNTSKKKGYAYETLNRINEQTKLPVIGNIPYLENPLAQLQSRKEKQSLIKEWNLHVFN